MKRLRRSPAHDALSFGRGVGVKIEGRIDDRGFGEITMVAESLDEWRELEKLMNDVGGAVDLNAGNRSLTLSVYSRRPISNSGEVR